MTNKKKKAVVDPDSVISHFSLVQITLDRFGEWSMKVTLGSQLAEAFRNYKVSLTLDERDFQEVIDKAQSKVNQLRTEPSLFEDGSVKTQLKDAKDALQKHRDKLEEMREKCARIEFESVVSQLKYGRDGRSTELVISVPPKTINDLNDKRLLLRYYQAELKVHTPKK